MYLISKGLELLKLFKNQSFVKVLKKFIENWNLLKLIYIYGNCKCNSTF